jgi:hypothetical protein
MTDSEFRSYPAGGGMTVGDLVDETLDMLRAGCEWLDEREAKGLPRVSRAELEAWIESWRGTDGPP